MSVPPFWPEKATEWVALIGGVMGGLLGTAAFALSLLNYRRDRANLKFVVTQETHYPPPEPDKFSIPDGIFFQLRITNVGRRPIRIESVYALLHNRPEFGPVLVSLEPENREADAGSVVLTESDPTVAYVSGPIEEDELSIRDIVRFEILDSAYRLYYHYHRNYVVTRVRQLQFRYRHRDWIYRIPPSRLDMRDVARWLRETRNEHDTPTS